MGCNELMRHDVYLFTHVEEPTPRLCPHRIVRRSKTIADKAQQRLCRRFRRVLEQQKPAPKIAVAIARELAGFVWATLQGPVAA